MASESGFQVHWRVARGVQKCSSGGLGGTAGTVMIAGASRLGGASDDWEPILDDIVGTNGSGMAVRGGQGGTGVTEVGIFVTEVAKGSVGVSRRS